jgi:hypothetical protein
VIAEKMRVGMKTNGLERMMLGRLILIVAIFGSRNN